jgi:hypothetical protein
LGRGGVATRHEHLPESSVDDVQMQDGDAHAAAIACFNVLAITPLSSPTFANAWLSCMLRKLKKRNAMLHLRWPGESCLDGRWELAWSMRGQLAFEATQPEV